ncbi:MAG: hypothetical protein J0L77_01990 [Alphaproteobacteria bacterium]|nr:hypothetical protein [Alphaproteobacteria bacterium]
MTYGSDWIKCDLHVHTPASFFHQYGDRNDPKVWEKFIGELEALPPEFQIIGVNDYLTVEGYKKLLAEKANGRLKNIACLLPVVEFRLNKLVGQAATKRVNYHVIFSDSLDPDTIQTQFLNALSATYHLEAGAKHPDWSGIVSEESLNQLGKLVKAQGLGNTALQGESDREVGFNNFNVDYVELEKILEFTPFKGKVITAIGKTEWDAYRWEGGGAADKRTIINKTDIVFLSVDSVDQYDKARQSLVSANVNSLLLDCSDAHYFTGSTQKDRIGNCFTWIKAEPTFDGLKQILFEPETRISVSETNPDKKAPYYVIESVRFVNASETFTDQEIRLSPYLNSIIGGKSTGKSLLAALIVKSSDIVEYERRSFQKSGGGHTDSIAWLDSALPDLDFEVRWKDGKVTSLLNDETRKVTYFPQHYLNSNVNDQGVGNKELNKIIRVVLSQNEHYGKAFDAYRDGLQGLDGEIASAATAFENALRDLREARHRTGEKGKSADVKANIAKLEQDFTSAKKAYDLSENEIAKHAALNQQISDLREQRNVIQSDIDVLASVTEQRLLEDTSIYSAVPELMYQSSEGLNAEVTAILNPIMEKARADILAAIAPVKTKYETVRGDIDEQIAALEPELHPILEKIAKSAPLREMSAALKSEGEKLATVLALEVEIDGLKTKITSLGDTINQFVDKRLALAGAVMKVMTDHPVAGGDDQLSVDIKPYIKSSHIQSLLKDRIKYQSNPDIREIVQIPEPLDTDVEGYRKAVSLVVKQSIEEKLEFKGEFNLAGVLQELLGNAFYLNYDLTLRGDSFRIMSPGKRALALLRIIVELDSSEHPIILDQPEDDLDNRSIYEGLASYLKSKKLARQIIVVTHNPNVVVGGDSEYVVVANQTGQESNQDNERFRFEYVYGGLELSFFDAAKPWVLQRQGIKEHVCEILDGGKDAFLRREQLYSTLKGRS